MKSKINTLLPIALAIILPGMGIYSNLESGSWNNLELYERWLLASSFIYILWHLLWYLTSLKYKYKSLWIPVILVLFIGLAQSIFLQFNLDFESHNVVRFIFVSLLILTVQYAVKAQENISRLLLEKEQIQTDNYRVQLQALRTKIDPHFLFNSLNTLRSMVRQHHDNSEKFIMSLSDFYRQILKHNENTILPLFEELNVLQSYIFLMKNRNEEAVNIHLEVAESLQQFHLPTLALQIVTENCFKHNSMTSKRPLHIEIYNTDDHYIVVKNNIQPKIGEQESSGFGLDSLRKRYALMNVQEGLIIQKNPQQFSVKLKLI